MTHYKKTEIDTKLTNESIVKILETYKGELLVTHGAGISRYNREKDVFEDLKILPEPMITYAIAEDNKENLWIGTYHEGLYYYNRTTKALKNYSKSSKDSKISDNLIYDILVDQGDRVWVATNNGLNLLKPEESDFQMFYSDDQDRSTLASDIVRDLFEDSKGRIWIGMTSGGIAYYDEENNNFVNFTEADGLSSNIVVGIEECIYGKIWVSTHAGISIIDLEENSIEILTPRDGIGGWEFNSGHTRDSDNNLYFGGVHGVTVIPTNFVDVETPTPKTYIKDILIFGKSINPNKNMFNDSHLIFDHKDQYLSFDLATIFHDAPDQVKYFYKLEGFNEAWVTIGSRNYISFSNLRPGEYVLNVRSKTLKTDYSSIEKIFFTIEKPWYLEYWAFILYFFGLLLIFHSGYTVRQWYMLKHKNDNLSQTNEELEESNKNLEEIATRDPLTGLYNRRYFNELMKDLVNIAKRESSELIFIMLDIDHFKAINDTFGHLAGDDYLIDVANVLKDELRRNTDFAVRYAGDEFVLVLFDTNKEKALEIAKTIQKRIKNTQVRKEYTKESYTTTVSMGMVCLNAEVDLTAKEVFKIADNALYSVKRKGKGNIEVISEFERKTLEDSEV